jgi:hypothetical protein
MVGCNIHQYVLNVWICVTLGFELFMLDALVSSAFIANCPNKVFEWEDYLIWDKPLSVTAAALLTYLIFPLFTIGYLAGKNDKRMGGSGGVDQSYFAGVWQSKILLRSMAAREEAGAYSYCTTLFYAVAMEFHCVIIPAYIPFICPALVMFQYEAALHNIAKFYIMLDVILKFGTNGLFFAWFLFCFSEGQISVTRKYVAGPRAAAEWRSMKFVYTWVSLIGTYLMIFSVKTYFTILYLWFIPLFITIFAFFGHALPYLMHGAPPARRTRGRPSSWSASPPPSSSSPASSWRAAAGSSRASARPRCRGGSSSRRTTRRPTPSRARSSTSTASESSSTS